jgi:large subunit ribosomal protein L15
MSRKRTEKMRGGRTHGRGKKAGRGAGKRGGRGNAGLHKHRHMHMLKNDPDHFGRKGFKRHPALSWDKTAVNVGHIQLNLQRYLESGIAKREGKTIVVDLTSTDVVKLLGAGEIKSPLTIKVFGATERAKEKVKAAGGKVELPFEPEPEEAPKAKKPNEEPEGAPPKEPIDKPKKNE